MTRRSTAHYLLEAFLDIGVEHLYGEPGDRPGADRQDSGAVERERAARSQCHLVGPSLRAAMQRFCRIVRINA